MCLYLPEFYWDCQLQNWKLLLKNVEMEKQIPHGNLFQIENIAKYAANCDDG